MALWFVCVCLRKRAHTCVFGAGWVDVSHRYHLVGGHFSSVSLQLLAQEIPASGILRSVGQGLGRGLWNPGCVRNKQEIAKMPASE